MVTTNGLLILCQLQIAALCSCLIGCQSTKITEEIHTQFCTNDSNCPTWFICDNNNKCQCGNEHDRKVICDGDNNSSAVLDCNYITYDKDTGSTYLGACFFNCENSNKTKYETVYIQLPKNPEMLLNKSVCNYFHRTGLLCGDCEDGHNPLVLSYNLSCVKCPDGHKNWWKFVLVAFVPLTFFYFFIVLFNINVTSSRLYGLVFFCQIMTTPAYVRLIFLAFRNSHQSLLIGVKVYLFFCSFWNLDLFRSITPDICLNITTLQSLALDYLLALYPFVLILFSYTFIHLYDRKIVCIVTIWKPFHKFLTFFRKSWDVRTSVIDSFSTFFLLSYFKILSVSADLLIPTQIYKLGSNTSTFGLYYSPSVAYFGDEHYSYAIMAIAIFTLFVMIPTITLFLYPFQFFQKCLSIFPINWHFLHAFVDAFQGCYKDGTEPGTFDCRAFSLFALLIRLNFFIIHGLSLSVIFFVYADIFLAGYLIAIINIQPFKKADARHPSTDTVFFILVSLCYIAVIGRNFASTQKPAYKQLMLIITFTLAFVSIAYMLYLIIFWFISRLSWIKSLLKAQKMHNIITFGNQ